MSDEPQFELVQGGDSASRLLELAALATELGSEHVASEASDLAARSRKAGSLLPVSASSSAANPR